MTEVNFDTLYKRSKTNKIVSYELLLQSNDVSFIIKKTGQIDGKKVIHKEEVSEGKNIGKSNETNHYQQALSQANSDWNKKKDEGYKSLEDLGIIVCMENGKTVYHDEDDGEKYTLENIINRKLPESNNTSKGIPLPMLAKKSDKRYIKFPCYVEPKFDGVRCILIANKDGQNISVKAYSRTGKEYITLSHIIDPVKEYLKRLAVEKYSFILDGEIYADTSELTFQEIVSAVKKEKESTKLLKYRVYDTINNMKQNNRKSFIYNIINDISSDKIIYVTYYVCHKFEELVQYHSDFIIDGYEGAIIRNIDSLYEIGHRSSNLLKYKEFDDNEFTFIGFEKGLRDEDLIAKCKSNKGEFKAKMSGTKEDKEALFTEESVLLNTQLTVKHFGYTDSGLPRFPIGVSFRDYE